MNNLLLFSFMFIMFMFLILNSMVFYWMDLMIICEWVVIEMNSLNMEFIMLFDWISLLFMSLILLISSMIMLYSMIYMMGEKFKNRFNILLVLFIISMILMVISPNLVSIMLGWDGLGLISYWLVMYYQNYMSYNSSMVTVLMNRIGDVGILMAISILMIKGSWNLMMFENSKVLMFMMLMAALTKSAQIPFSVWLPMAMAAPTPVSALVHSSTLVTAGVYMMIRFNNFLMESGVSQILMVSSVFTMVMSGVMANFETDFKKIIALSTLSQLGLMMMVLSLGLKILAFYHLLIHALFKSMLFMAAGIIIHSMKNNQDIRLLGNLNEILPFTMMSFLISNMALCGMPFLSGFYSKDMIMEMVYVLKMNMMMMILIIISLSFTISYSLRFFVYLFFNMNTQFYSYNYISENKLMNMSMIMLMMMSIMSGSMMNWMFFYDYTVIYLSITEKLMTLVMCISGIIMVYLIKLMMKKFKFFYYLMYYFSSMWFLMMISLSIYEPLNKMSLKLYEFDKNWVEFLMKNLLMNFILMKFINMNYKFYMFMCMFIYMLILINLMG